MILKKIGIFVGTLLLASFVNADVLEVKENHPTKYVVQKGDTLWDISGKFLKKPWYWPKIWNVNPQINDPHWIYPGDVLTLVWVDGKPYVQRATPAVKKGNPIPTVDSSKVQSFLLADTVLPLDCDALPYVFGNNDGRELIAETENVYVKGNVVKGTQYGAYHKGDLIKDEEGKELGYKAIFVGVIVTADGEANNLTKAFIVKNKSAVQRGDYLLPLNDFAGNNLYFVPKAAKVDTSVVSLGLDGKVAGQYDTVMLGKGSKDGVTPGDVFSIMREGKQITGRDVSSNKYAEFDGLAKRMTASSENKLPNELIGQVMVYRTYENVSLAIIMKAKDSVSVGYKALQP